jgi:hypothetical protein
MLYNFFVRNLRIFIVARVFVLGKLFQPSLMFASKAGSYLSEAFSGAPI